MSDLTRDEFVSTFQAGDVGKLWGDYAKVIKERNDAFSGIVPAEFSLRFVGQEVQHSFFVYHIMSLILEANPQIAGIVELGTGTGGLTMYLGMWAARRGIPMTSFDINAYAMEAEGIPAVFEALGVNYEQHNVFQGPGHERARAAVTGKPIYLFCDNGNKPEEFKMFVPMLESGSVVSVHDWTAEIRPEHVEAVVAEHKLEPFRQDLWLKHAAIMATWKKP
jgi:hypothetical protein